MLLQAEQTLARHARAQQLERHGLRLVQHDHAARDVVQLAALRGLGREQAFKELHSRGDDDGRIPVFHGQLEFFAGLVFFRVTAQRLGLHKGAVVLKNCSLAQRPQGLAEYSRVLLDDAGERNHKDHATQAMAYRMIERKGQ